MSTGFNIDTLIRSAGHDYDALAEIAFTQHLTDVAALRIATHALDAAIEECGGEVPTALYSQALARLLADAWDAREAKQQADIAEDEAIWIGAARHEARGEL